MLLTKEQVKERVQEQENEISKLEVLLKDETIEESFRAQLSQAITMLKRSVVNFEKAHEKYWKEAETKSE